MGRIAPLVGVLSLACLFVGDAWLSPAWADWTTPDGITWWSNPSPSKVGKCIGNCGKDCSNSLNPCTSKFPDTGYWTSEYIWGPNFVQYVDSSNVCCEEWQPQFTVDDGNTCYGYNFQVHYEQYEAALRFTYHGVYSNFCSDHDHACRSPLKVYGLVYCIFPIDVVRACSHQAHYQTWSHDEYAVGQKDAYRYITSWGYGPC